MKTKGRMLVSILLVAVLILGMVPLSVSAATPPQITYEVFFVTPNEAIIAKLLDPTTYEKSNIDGVTQDGLNEFVGSDIQDKEGMDEAVVKAATAFTKIDNPEVPTAAGTPVYLAVKFHAVGEWDGDAFDQQLLTDVSTAMGKTFTGWTLAAANLELPTDKLEGYDPFNSGTAMGGFYNPIANGPDITKKVSGSVYYRAAYGDEFGTLNTDADATYGAIGESTKASDNSKVQRLTVSITTSGFVYPEKYTTWDYVVPLQVKGTGVGGTDPQTATTGKTGGTISLDLTTMKGTSTLVAYVTDAAQAGTGFSGTGNQTKVAKEQVDAGKVSMVSDPSAGLKFDFANPSVNPTTVPGEESQTTYSAVDNRNLPYVAAESAAANDTLTIPNGVDDNGGAATGFYFGDTVVVYKKNLDGSYAELGRSLLSAENAVAQNGAELGGAPTVTLLTEDADLAADCASAISALNPTKADGYTFRLVASGKTDNKFGLLKGQIAEGEIFYIGRMGPGDGRGISSYKVPVKMGAKTTTAADYIEYDEDVALLSSGAGSQATPIVVEYGSNISDMLASVETTLTSLGTGSEVRGMDDALTVATTDGNTATASLKYKWGKATLQAALYDGSDNGYVQAVKKNASAIQVVDANGKFIRYGTFAIKNPFAETESVKNPTDTTDPTNYPAPHGAVIYVKVKPKEEDFVLYKTPSLTGMRLAGDTKANVKAGDKVEFSLTNDFTTGLNATFDITSENKNNTAMIPTVSSDSTLSTAWGNVIAGTTKVYIRYYDGELESYSDSVAVTVVDGNTAQVSGDIHLSADMATTETWDDLLDRLTDDVTFQVSGPADAAGNLPLTTVTLTPAQFKAWAETSNKSISGLAVYAMSNGSPTGEATEATLKALNNDPSEKTGGSSYSVQMKLPAASQIPSVAATLPDDIKEFTNPTEAKVYFTVTALKSVAIKPGPDPENYPLVKVVENKPLGVKDTLEIWTTGTELATALSTEGVKDTLRISLYDTSDGTYKLLGVAENSDITKTPRMETKTINSEDVTFSVYTIKVDQTARSKDQEFELFIDPCFPEWTSLSQGKFKVGLTEEYTAFEVSEFDPDSVEVAVDDLPATGAVGSTAVSARVKQYFVNNAASYTVPQITYGWLKRDSSDSTKLVRDTATEKKGALPGVTLADAAWTISEEQALPSGSPTTGEYHLAVSALEYAKLYDVSGTVTQADEAPSNSVKINVDNPNVSYEGSTTVAKSDFTETVKITGAKYTGDVTTDPENPGSDAWGVVISTQPTVVNNPYPLHDQLTIKGNEPLANDLVLHVYKGVKGVDSWTVGEELWSGLVLTEDQTVTLNKDLDSMGGVLFFKVNDPNTAPSDPYPTAPAALDGENLQKYDAENYVIYGAAGVDPTIIKKALSTVKVDGEGANRAIDFTKISALLPSTVTVTAAHLENDGNGGYQAKAGETVSATANVTGWYFAADKTSPFNASTHGISQQDMVDNETPRTAEIVAGYNPDALISGSQGKVAIINATGDTQEARIVASASPYSAAANQYDKSETLTLSFVADADVDTPTDVSAVTTQVSKLVLDPSKEEKYSQVSVPADATNDKQAAEANTVLTDDTLSIKVAGDSGLNNYDVIIGYRSPADKGAKVHYLWITTPFAASGEQTLTVTTAAIQLGGTDKTVKTEIASSDTAGSTLLASVSQWDSAFGGIYYGDSGSSANNKVTVYLHTAGKDVTEIATLTYKGVELTKYIGEDTSLGTVHLAAGEYTMDDIMVYAGVAERKFPGDDTSKIPEGIKSITAAADAYAAGHDLIANDLAFVEENSKPAWHLQTRIKTGGEWGTWTTSETKDGDILKALYNANYVKTASADASETEAADANGYKLKKTHTAYVDSAYNFNVTGEMEIRLAAEFADDDANSVKNATSGEKKVAYIELKLYNVPDHPLQLVAGNSDLYHYGDKTTEIDGKDYSEVARNELSNQIVEWAAKGRAVSQGSFMNDLVFYYRVDSYERAVANPEMIEDVSRAIDTLTSIDKTRTLAGLAGKTVQVKELAVGDDGYGSADAQLRAVDGGNHIDPAPDTDRDSYFVITDTAQGITGSVTHGEEYYRVEYYAEDGLGRYLVVRNVKLTYQPGNAYLDASIDGVDGGIVQKKAKYYSTYGILDGNGDPIISLDDRVMNFNNDSSIDGVDVGEILQRAKNADKEYRLRF